MYKGQFPGLILSASILLASLLLPAAAQTTDYDAVYQTALEAFKSGKYIEAISGFQGLLNRSRVHPLSDNAQYWLGECHYAKKNYLKAAIEFEKVFTFPTSNKHDDAQLKLGLCYLRLDDKEGARREFTHLLSRYPNSEFADLAKKMLNEL